MRSKYFGAMLGLICAAPMAANAQNATPPTAVPNETAAKATILKSIPLRYVPADVIAWQIDPEHHPEPLIFTQSRNMMRGDFSASANVQPLAPFPAGRRPRTADPQAPAQNTPNPFARGGNQGNKADGGGLFSLREQGVESLTADPVRQELIVRGTPQGIEAVENIVAFLDRPLRQVEVEVQAVQLSATDAKQIGIDFTSSNGSVTASPGGTTQVSLPNQLNIGLARGNFRAALNDLVNRKRAVMVAAPRVTVINNLAAQLQFAVDSVDLALAIKGKAVPLAQRGLGSLKVESRATVVVTPTINNDDTVTIVMSPQNTQWLVGAALPAANLGDLRSFQNGDQLQTPGNPMAASTLQAIANVRDGETIVLSGLPSGWLSPSDGKAAPKTVGKQLMLFVTARILRRLNDDAAAPQP